MVCIPSRYRDIWGNKLKINQKHFRVAIFGSARTKKGTPHYKLVHSLAKKIADEGMDIVTGGGPGLMDAASRGHHASKNKTSHSVGLTIQLPREQFDGYHLDVKKDFKKFSGRLDTFMKLSNVVVGAPGGIGTVLELFYTWQLVQVEHICNTPIILLGSMWEPLLDWVKGTLVKKGMASKKDLDSIFLVKTPNQAMKIIKEAKERSKDKKICVNMKKYR